MPTRYRDCEWCGFTFPSKNIRARYCKDSHRAAANRARRLEAQLLGETQPQPPEAPAMAPLDALLTPDALRALAEAVAAHLHGAITVPTTSPAPWDDADTDIDDAPPALPIGPVEAATRAQLAAAHRSDSALGLSAVVLAMRIDNSQGETGGALAALTKALQERLTAALTRGVVAAPGTDASEDDDGDVASVDPLEKHRKQREARRFAGA